MGLYASTVCGQTNARVLAIVEANYVPATFPEAVVRAGFIVCRAVRKREISTRQKEGRLWSVVGSGQAPPAINGISYLTV